MLDRLHLKYLVCFLKTWLTAYKENTVSPLTVNFSSLFQGEKKKSEPTSSKSIRQPKIFQKPFYDFQTSLVDSTGLIQGLSALN